MSETELQDRAKAVVPRSAAPSLIAESVARPPSSADRPKALLATQLPQGDAKAPLRGPYRHWTVVYRVTPWLLRVLLLLTSVTKPRGSARRCLEHEGFAFFGYNVAQLVSELVGICPETAPAANL